MRKVIYLFLAIVFSWSRESLAQEHMHQHDAAITIENPWMRSTPPRAKAAAVYLIVVNHGETKDRLLSVTTPITVEAGFHNSVVKDGVRVMEDLDGIDVIPHQPQRFEPGGQHIMLMGLTQTITAGEMIPLTLTFESFGDIEVEVAVLAPGETPKKSPHAQDHHMHESDHSMHH